LNAAPEATVTLSAAHLTVVWRVLSDSISLRAVKQNA